jgi:hypothetical protein
MAAKTPNATYACDDSIAIKRLFQGHGLRNALRAGQAAPYK